MVVLATSAHGVRCSRPGFGEQKTIKCHLMLYGLLILRSFHDFNNACMAIKRDNQMVKDVTAKDAFIVGVNTRHPYGKELVRTYIEFN